MLSENEVITIDFDKIIRFFRSEAVQIFLLTFTIYALMENHILSSGPDGLTLMTQASIFFHHSFALITKNYAYTNDVQDMVFYNGAYYGSQSFGLAFLLFPISIIGFALDHTYNIFGYASLFDRLAVSFISSMLIVSVYKIVKDLSGKKENAVLASIALAFTTTVWPFSEIIYYHTFSALATVIFVYYLYKYLNNYNVEKKLIFSSILLGYATFTDYSTALSTLSLSILGIIFSIKMKKIRIGVISSILPIFLAVVFQGIINLAVFNNIFFTAGLQKGNFSFNYMFNHAFYYLISPYRGLLFFDPLFYLALYYAIKTFKKNVMFNLMLIVPFISTLFFVSSWKYWDGGLSYGPRFLISSISLLFLSFANAKDLKNNTLFITGFVFGYFVNLLGVMQAILPVSPNNYLGFGNPFSFFQFKYELNKLINGEAPLWIMFGNGITKSYLILYSLIGIVTFLVFFSAYKLTKNERLSHFAVSDINNNT